MKNIFLTLFRLFAKRRILALLFLFGPLASQGAARANQESRLNQAIVFELLEAIKSEDSKTYEGLFYDLAPNLKASGDFRRLLLSAKDERGNNIFHLMAGVSPESPAGLFFQHEIMNLLLFLSLPDSLKLNHHVSLGGMAYSEMPKALQREKGSMSIDSVVKKFLDAKNKEGQTPELIARNNQNPHIADNFHQFAQIPVIARHKAASADLPIPIPFIGIPTGLVGGLFVGKITYDMGIYLTDREFTTLWGLIILISSFGPFAINRLAKANKCRQAINGQLSSLIKKQSN